MEDSDSKVEALPTAKKPEAKRVIGRLDNEESVSINAPSPLRKGAKLVPRAAVGLRAAPKSATVSEKAVETHGAVRQKVRESRDQHRQKVWDKLDAARQKADAKKPRLDKFSPKYDPDSARESGQGGGSKRGA